MGGQGQYGVTVAPAAWRKLVVPPQELAERVRVQLERLAAEAPTHPGRAPSVRTVLLEGGYSLVVAINHEARTVTLLEVARVT